MSFRLCYFHPVKVKTFGKIYLFCCMLLNYLGALLVPYIFNGWTLDFYWSIFPAPIQFYSLIKDFWRDTEQCRNFWVTLEYVLHVHRTYWSVKEVILKQYWRVLYSNLEGESPISITVFLQYVFTLTAGKMKNAILKNVLAIKKPIEVILRPRTYSFLSKNSNSISWASPFNVRRKTTLASSSQFLHMPTAV